MRNALFPNGELASQNLGNVFFGLGALVTPALIGALLRRLDYRRAIGLLALFCLLPAGIAAFTEQSQFSVDGGPTSLAAVLGNPMVWMAGLVFLLYGLIWEAE